MKNVVDVSKLALAATHHAAPIDTLPTPQQDDPRALAVYLARRDAARSELFRWFVQSLIAVALASVVPVPPRIGFKLRSRLAIARAGLHILERSEKAP